MRSSPTCSRPEDRAAGTSATTEPVFQEPWQAQAFAIAVLLEAQGHFSWGEWAAMLGEEIRLAQSRGDPDTGQTYYRHWLAALERLVTQKGLASAQLLAEYRRAWERAAVRTPHGTPLRLAAGDFHQS